MNRLVLTVLLAFVFSATSYADEYNAPSNPKCYGYLTQLVRNSTFPFKTSLKNRVNLLVYTDQADEILAKVFIDNNFSEGIGWVKYDARNNVLLNPMADLDTPKRLKFHNKYARLFSQCKRDPGSVDYVEPLKFKDEFPKYCKEITSNVNFERKISYDCFYPNKKLTTTYLRIKNLIENGHLLEKTIKPMKNLEYAVDAEAANISYRWLDRSALKVILKTNAGTATYLFEEERQGTQLQVNIKKD